jgi:hypothetical protein
MMRRLRLVAFASLLLAAALPPRKEPIVTMTRSGAMTILLPTSVLTAPEVRKQLSSGLTTAFVITASTDTVEGAARIDIRYELWDEVYLVTTTDASARVENVMLASDDRLLQWWRDTPILLIPRARNDGRARIRMRIVPFSAREEADTKRWLRRALDLQGNVGGGVSDDGTAGILDVIVGTSIRRKPILEYRWSVPVRPEQAQ